MNFNYTLISQGLVAIHVFPGFNICEASRLSVKISSGGLGKWLDMPIKKHDRLLLFLHFHEIPLLLTR